MRNSPIANNRRGTPRPSTSFAFLSLHAFAFCMSLFLGVLAVQIPVSVAAQGQCEPASSIRFPFDTSQFTLVQDFGAPSPRHQGRYHTGEDWYGGRGSSLGTPVRAIANGRVTFSSTNGWGRDGGVIILEHTFPDGTIAYSQYGHIQEAETTPFPAVFACVREGDIIAAVGDARPAPHLHLEIRTNNPDIPGPGYTYDFPTQLGWRRASKFILNWQTWFADAHAWHLDLADEAGPVAPPILLPDQNLIYLDADRLIRASHDGRVLWRVNFDQTAVGLIERASDAAVIFADGSVRAVTYDGTLGQSWNIGTSVQSMIQAGWAQPIFYTPQRSLIAVDTDLWTFTTLAQEIDPIVRAASSAGMISLITQTHHLITLDASGAVIDQANLREAGALLANPDGVFAYTQGGFWNIDSSGGWSLVLPDAPAGGAGSAIAHDPTTEQLYAFDGFTMRAYDAARAQRWTVDLPGVGGETSLLNTGDFLILSSTFGNIAAIRSADGAVCNTARIFGDRRSHLWTNLGDDGMLRVYVADQILALDWQTFLLGCA